MFWIGMILRTVFLYIALCLVRPDAHASWGVFGALLLAGALWEVASFLSAFSAKRY
jgi:hypothetical protein